MGIKIKNIKSLRELDRRRTEKINNEVINFLDSQGYKINKLSKDPLGELIQEIHKDGKKVMVDTRNEKLDKNRVNGLLILSFDLIIYFKDR